MGITEILMQQAFERGVEEGRKKGREEMMEIMTQITERRERKRIVHKLMSKDFSPHSIADILCYPLEEVRVFFKELETENYF